MCAEREHECRGGALGLCLKGVLWGRGRLRPKNLCTKTAQRNLSVRKFYCLRQGTSKRDAQRCGGVVHCRSMKFRPSRCKHAQNSAFRGQ